MQSKGRITFPFIIFFVLFSDIYTNTYGGGGVVASGVEETTGVGYGTGTGYGTAGGISGTGEVKGSIGGTIKEYREGGVNMAFLDNYFSEVMTRSSLHYICKPTVRASSPSYRVEIQNNPTQTESSLLWLM